MGSPPSWPFMDYCNPLSSLLQEELPPHPPPLVITSNSASSSPPLPFPPPSPLLSSPASLGASTAKISKRKSRAVTKPPIRVLSADRETFRDMVQKLTGIPTSPIALQAGRLWGTATAANSSSAALFRPMPARPGSSYQREFSGSGTASMAHQSMPTLDTSSAYLTRGFSNGSNLVYNEVGNARLKNDYYEVSYGAEEAAAAAAAVEGAQFAEGLNQSIEGMSDIESLLMGGTKLEDLLQGRMASWLTPHLEIAHSA